MRVLHVTPYFAPAFCYGGPPRSILGLCRGLQQAGVDVQVFATTANGASDLPSSLLGGDWYDGIPVRYFPRAFPRRFFGLAGLGAALASEIVQYDIIHIHGLWNVPAWTAAQHAQRTGVPYVLSPRGMLDTGSIAHRSMRKRAAYWLMERRNLVGATFLHATSSAEARTLQSCRLGVKVVMLPNGVDVWDGEPLGRGAFRQRLGLDANARLVIFLGRLHPIKRLDLLTAAFNLAQVACPEAHLVIAGPEEGSYRREIVPLLDRAGAMVHWTGELSEAEKWSLLADADVLVMCSDSESFGMSVVEAMAAGVPVVVTRTCPWEEVETAGCGLWITQEVGAIADAIQWLLANPLQAQAMGERGKNLVRNRYAWEPIARAMTDCYAAAVAASSRTVSFK
jgi:glycosyltransferase involved in cell wall biosynthesis